MTPNPSEVIDLKLKRQAQNGGRPETYYNRPALRSSPYGWRIATGFFAIGLAAGCQVLSALLDRTGREEDLPVVRAGRYLAAAGAFAGPILYIADLHTPRRWFNMLRIFRKTSLMSIGSWSLTAFGALSGLTAIGQLLEDLGHRKAGRRVARIAEIPAALAALIPSLYKGTELEETSIPLWSSAYPFLGPLLASSDAKTAASALSLVSGFSGRDASRKGLDLVTILSGGLELIFAVTAAGRMKGRSSVSSLQGLLLGASIIAPLALRLVESPAPGKAAPRLSSAAGLLGGFVLPVALIFAGNRSGTRPSEYFASVRPAAPAGKTVRDKGHSRANMTAGIALAGAAALFYGITRVKERP